MEVRLKNNRKILNRVLNVLTLSQFKRYENEMMEKERDKRAENGVKSFSPVTQSPFPSSFPIILGS